MGGAVRCGCGRASDRPWAQALGGDGRPRFLLCERCVRDPAKRQHLASSFARGAFGVDATLVWFVRVDGFEQRDEARWGDSTALERFRGYDAP